MLTWMRQISHGMMVPGAECGVAFPTGAAGQCQDAQASLGKKLKEIISQISTTIFHNFCY